MANPILLLVKPLLKALSKEAVVLLTKEAVKQGGSAGLKAMAKGTLSALDSVNIMRSAVDKKILPSVAKSLGMSTKELREITKAINLTEARRNAVKGRNFIKNVNRFIDNPQTSIKNYVKKELGRNVREKTSEVLKDTIDTLVKRNALRLLEGKLKQINSKLSLSKNIWDSVDILEVDMIFEVMEYLEADFYYTAHNSEPDNPIYLDTDHKGFSKGMEEQEFITMIEDMLLDGYHSTTVDGIY